MCWLTMRMHALNPSSPFKSMMEYTPENHADYPYIAQSRETLEKVTNYVNEKQREWERIQPLMEVKERISSCDVVRQSIEEKECILLHTLTIHAGVCVYVL